MAVFLFLAKKVFNFIPKKSCIEKEPMRNLKKKRIDSF